MTAPSSHAANDGPDGRDEGGDRSVPTQEDRQGRGHAELHQQLEPGAEPHHSGELGQQGLDDPDMSGLSGTLETKDENLCPLTNCRCFCF